MELSVRGCAMSVVCVFGRFVVISCCVSVHLYKIKKSTTHICVWYINCLFLREPVLHSNDVPQNIAIYA